MAGKERGADAVAIAARLDMAAQDRAGLVRPVRRLAIQDMMVLGIAVQGMARHMSSVGHTAFGGVCSGKAAAALSALQFDRL